MQRAFGCNRSAEQSVVQQTLDTCTPETIEQMRATLIQIARKHGQTWQTRQRQQWLILDVDLSALPCGKQAQGATKGYIPGRRGRRGRQLGRVYASETEEIVAELLYEGHTHLWEVLQALVEQAQESLQLDEQARQHTLIRCDAGGGTIDNINWLLSQGYGLLCKEFSSKRAKALAKTIEHWMTDPSEPGRSLGVVEMPCLDYQQPQRVRRLVVRTQPSGDPQAQPHYSVLVCNLLPEQVFSLLGQYQSTTAEQEQLARAIQHLYDLRGGGVETAYKADKHGLGLSQRNKKRFGGQQMLTLLASLAHNVLIWARSWLFEPEEMQASVVCDDDLLPEAVSGPVDPLAKVRRYGIKRLVRDVLHLSGCLHFRRGKIVAITFNQAAPLAPLLAAAFHRLLTHQSVIINLDQI
ncbi:MAG: transposase [Ktedonobacteraceae bacterium]|nr:transposase [Ktedonobacteraceae bacterium]